MKAYTSALSAALAALLPLIAVCAQAAGSPRRFPIQLKPGEVVPTGNEWLSLPDIRAADGALGSFNVLSMRDRGLLQVDGEKGSPALQPYFEVDGKPFRFDDPSWELIEYWIPAARLERDGLQASLTWCAPPGSRAAFARLTLANRGARPVSAALGMRASFGSLSRVTYLPIPLKGERTMDPALWVSPGETFRFVTHDTFFAWSLIHSGAVVRSSTTASVDAAKSATVAPGETLEAVFVLGVGIEEFSAPHSARVLRELLERGGPDGVIADAAAWSRRRTRATGDAELDMIMNRNLLFTALYAWGKTLDTERLVGATSRSPRYYVSAAYWDRDAMLWSLPGLLDFDLRLAREALDYALTVQLRDTGTHSRFIDGVVLEDGFQLDEAVAPILAAAEYARRAEDSRFLAEHRGALEALRDRLLSRFDPAAGLFSTLQDSQDEYRPQPFLTYDNVLAWKALRELAGIFGGWKDAAAAKDLERRARALRAAILERLVSDKAPGAAGSIFACGTDGKEPLFDDIPPGSLMKLPQLGFIKEDDPLFVRTYDWLHSKAFKHSYYDQPFGLPGSYRLPFTTSWSVADHLALSRGRARALKVLKGSRWDAGIISEGVDPKTGVMDDAGGAFATAAGYVGHAICRDFCRDR